MRTVAKQHWIFARSSKVKYGKILNEMLFGQFIKHTTGAQRQLDKLNKDGISHSSNIVNRNINRIGTAWLPSSLIQTSMKGGSRIVYTDISLSPYGTRTKAVHVDQVQATDFPYGINSYPGRAV
ncbi:hypothetical protein RRG08_050325 [Elysia crispata]|uniref:Uncharacterized protein n=1 Tax=Elysia crispata TaxID=231223 RepID=A0AAE0ZZ62_9GAST|nr:hypothetical protein RRG08_050325 [Elysia crispata]